MQNGSININKCSIITVSKKANIIFDSQTSQWLSASNLVRDLGVMLDSRLSFNEHLEYRVFEINLAPCLWVYISGWS